ncbi:hypothetical protein [Luteimonas aquatica]|uniref:hypothetical protein n=1 Tax=Luteimonas aquatica TaxID=450364 RepID=UPI001F55F7F2|nr:hypothetical protein [Luteimonas aquatica]
MNAPPDDSPDAYAFDRDALAEVFVDRDALYAVLRDEQAGVAVLEITVPWVAWYGVYFWLTAEELALLREDKPAFDRLVRSYAQDKGERLHTDRLLLHQGPGGERHPASRPRRAYPVGED